MRVGCRKGSLDPKTMGVIDYIDFDGMSDSDDLHLPSPGSGKPKSDCNSFKNEMTKRLAPSTHLVQGPLQYKNADGRSHAP